MKQWKEQNTTETVLTSCTASLNSKFPYTQLTWCRLVVTGSLSRADCRTQSCDQSTQQWWLLLYLCCAVRLGRLLQRTQLPTDSKFAEVGQRARSVHQLLSWDAHGADRQEFQAVWKRYHLPPPQHVHSDSRWGEVPITPLYIRMNRATKIVNILYYKNKKTSHYAFISNISRLIFNSTKSHNRKFVCPTVLAHTYSQEALNNHLDKKHPTLTTNLCEKCLNVFHTQESKEISWQNLYGQKKKSLRIEKTTSDVQWTHTLLELRKLIPQKTAEANRAKSTAEKLPVLKELEALWRERLSQQKCAVM